MATQTKRYACDWCKMRRVCEKIQVIMRSPGKKWPSVNMYTYVFVRNWQLCSECTARCASRLRVQFRHEPE